MTVGSDVVEPFEVSALTAGCIGRRRFRYAYSGFGLVFAFEARKYSYFLVAALMAALVLEAMLL